MTAKHVVGVCPHDCPDTCGLVTEVDAHGRAVSVRGMADHPVTQGWLCAKVRPYLDHVYHPDRLTQPLRRAGPKGSGQWAPVSWDEAIAEIAGRWQAIIAQYGGEAILPYSYSGTLGLLQMGVVNARLWNRMGASRLNRDAICGAAGAMAVKATLGSKHGAPYPQLLDSKLIIIWGHNPVSTAPHLMPWLNRARRAGAQVVVIDPRRTRTARQADWHVSPRPGTDGALALGLGHIIVREGWHDEHWLNTYTTGWPELRARLASYSPARVSAITGLATGDIERLARLYASTRPGLIKFADGLQRHQNGGQTVRAVLTLPALTGQYGVRGGGIAYSTGGWLSWDKAAINHWEDCPPPGRELNIARLGAALTGEAQDPPVMSLYVYGANPVASSPNSALIVAGLKRDDLFTVVHEQFMTDTADYADIVLPATSQLEHHDLHKGYGHTLLQYNRPAIAPLGACRSNWDVMRLLASALGYSEPWLHDDAETVLAEVLAATVKAHPVLAGLTLADLQGGQPVAIVDDDVVPYASAVFATPSGKVELFSRALADMGLDPLPGYVPNADPDAAHPPDGAHGDGGLQLVSPAAHHFVSSSFANHADFEHREGEPFVEINPADAALRGIADGDAVELVNRRGTVRLRAVVTDAVQPGVVASPKGRWARRHGGRNINWTTTDAVSDFAGQSSYHSTVVWLRKAGAHDDHA